MERQYLVAALVLAVGAFACERKSEPTPSETTTTSGTMGEEQEQTETTGAPSVRAGDTTGAKAAGGGAGTMKAGETVSEESLRAGGDAGVAMERRDPDVGTTKCKATKPKATTEAKTNESTTLGDGTSGQYTGGKGTYGGKATHGTGGDADEK